MYKLKLGPKARTQFYDPNTRVIVRAGKTVEVETLTDFMRKRLKGGHLALVETEEDEPEVKKDPTVIEVLMGHTKKQIIYTDFDYFDDEDTKSLLSIRSKKALVAKALELAKDYEDDDEAKEKEAKEKEAKEKEEQEAKEKEEQEAKEKEEQEAKENEEQEAKENEANPEEKPEKKK